MRGVTRGAVIVRRISGWQGGDGCDADEVYGVDLHLWYSILSRGSMSSDAEDGAKAGAVLRDQA
jgi:hypothetical protein